MPLLLRPQRAGGAAAVAALAAAAMVVAAATAQAPKSTLDVRCVGSEVAATLSPQPGKRVTRVEFVLRPSGVDSVDKTPPYEAHFGQDEQGGGRQSVVAQVYGAGAPEEVGGKPIARCPRRIAGQPPLASRLVEGVAMGGVEIGMTFGEVEEAWGSPRSTACHGSSGAAPQGSPTYRFGGMVCYWAIQRVAGGVGDGLIRALFGVGPESGGRASPVEELALYRGRGRLPKYRRWKSSRGVGLGTPRSALARAYGGRLHRVPFREGREPGDYDPYYVVTTRGSTRWVTAFDVAMAHPRGSMPPPASVGDRVSSIEILPAASYRSMYAGQARQGWRP